MEFIRISEIKNLFEQKKINDEFQIKCWVKSNRDSGKIGFINAFDGSNIDGIQIVYKEKLTKGFEQAKAVRTGSAISVKGHINQNEKSPTKYEIVANEIFISKQADEDYPLQKNNIH
jgi:asparaginyl-tRNA synthetase